VCLDELNRSDGRSRGHVDSRDHPALRLPRLCLHRAGGVRRRPYLRPAATPQCPLEGCSARAFVRSYSGDVIISMLGPNLTQERFRLAAYYLTDLAFQASGDGPLGWGEFMERYSTMYPRGQPGLPDDPVTAYVDSLCATSIVPGSTTTRRAAAAQRHDPTRECNACMAPASSSSESEHAPRHRGADAQRRAQLD
jgi:hypothetical protein